MVDIFPGAALRLESRHNTASNTRDMANQNPHCLNLEFICEAGGLDKLVISRYGRLPAVEVNCVAPALSIVINVLRLFRGPAADFKIMGHDSRPLLQLLFQKRAHFIV